MAGTFNTTFVTEIILKHLELNHSAKIHAKCHLKKINLSIVMNLNYIRDKHQNSLLELLQKYKKMFDGTLGKYTGSIYTIESKENAKAYHANTFPIRIIHELTLKKEVNRLIKIGVLKKINIPNGQLQLLLYPR